MGQGTKNQSRHQQISANREKIDTLISTVKKMLTAWESHVEHETGKDLLSHQEIDEWLGTIAENEDAHFAMLLELKERVEWNEMPFYRRWWRSYMDEKTAMVHAGVRTAIATERKEKEKIKAQVKAAVVEAIAEAGGGPQTIIAPPGEQVEPDAPTKQPAPVEGRPEDDRPLPDAFVAAMGKGGASHPEENN